MAVVDRTALGFKDNGVIMLFLGKSGEEFRIKDLDKDQTEGKDRKAQHHQDEDQTKTGGMSAGVQFNLINSNG